MCVCMRASVCLYLSQPVATIWLSAEREKGGGGEREREYVSSVGGEV